MHRNTLILALAALMLAACTREPQKPDATPAPAVRPDLATAALPPAEPAPHELFLAGLPQLRKTLRTASLRPGTELPDDLPLYDLTIRLDVEFMTYDGTLDLWVKNRSSDPWNHLAFHLYPNVEAIAGTLRHLKVTSASVAGTVVEGRDLGHRYELPLAVPLAPGESTVVHIDFKGLLKRSGVHEQDPISDLWGVVLSMLSGAAGDWGIFAYSSRTASLSLWYPLLAAYDASGWDRIPADEMGDFSYFDASDYRVRVEADPAWRVVGSGVESKEGEVQVVQAGGVREMTLIMAPHLIPEERRVGGESGVLVRSYARPDNTQTRRLVVEAAADALAVFEKRFGPYPYTELDIVQTDLFGGAGGVEFPGLVTIASFLYLDTWKDLGADSNDLMQSRFMRESLQFVVAHEVAHQWWNAVVGSHSRNHPFLDEALANFSALLYFEDVQGDAAAMRQKLIQVQLPYQLHRFMGGKDMPVDLPTSAFSDLMGYSAIVYCKGALYLEKVRRLVGDAAFMAGLQGYYRKHSFAIATPADLEAALAGKQADEVASLARRWLRETHGDEDVGQFDPAIVVPLVLDELGLELDGFVLKTLKEEGFWEGVKVVANLVEGKEDPFENVRLDKLKGWVTDTAKKVVWDLLM